MSVGAFGPGTYDERGLLGLAFHPDYQRNGLFYAFESEQNSTVSDFPVPQSAAANTQSTVVEWQVTSPNTDGAVADPTSARVVMRWAKPQFNHNGGAIVFRPDGMLYIGTGDGGAANDRGAGHVPGGNPQNPSNLLGKVLRIDVDKRTAPNGQYGIPRDNPFAPCSGPAGGQAGCVDGQCDEIYASAFRNAFRISFDRKTGDLYAGDVGQNTVEEIDVVRRGANYGWPYKEGSFFFEVDPVTNLEFVSDTDPGVPPRLVEPLAEDDHSEGIAIVGGFVYRGRAIDGLKGRYVFGDYARTFGASHGRLMHLVRPADDEGRRGTSEMTEFKLADRTALGLAVTGFAQDGRGEVYVPGNTTGVPSGRTRVVLKLVPANDDGRSRPRDDHED